MRHLIIAIIFGVAGWQAYEHYQGKTAKPKALPEVPVVPAPSVVSAPAAISLPVSQYKCDGRTYCSQMTSCEEATYFLRNCPGVQMDGDHDGIPCEQQWCRR